MFSLAMPFTIVVRVLVSVLFLFGGDVTVMLFLYSTFLLGCFCVPIWFTRMPSEGKIVASFLSFSSCRKEGNFEGFFVFLSG